MRGIAAGLALGLSITLGAGAPAQSDRQTDQAGYETGPFTPEVFDIWIDARAGTGEPVYWYSTGTVRAFPSGELLFEMEGYDASTAFRPEGEDVPVAHQYNRKIYVYRDPETGEIIEEMNGMEVQPVAYPYQFITYTLEDGEMQTVVEQGAGERLQTFTDDKMSWRRLGDTYVFTAPVFLDIPIGPDRRLEAWENYDFFIHPDGAVEEPHQLSWARVGRLPPWAGGQMAVLHLITWRMEDYEAIPARFRDYIETEAPLWRVPPADLAEIRALQQGE